MLLMESLYLLPEHLRLDIVKRVVTDLSKECSDKKDVCDMLVRDYDDFMNRVRYYYVDGDRNIVTDMADSFWDTLGNLPPGCVFRVNRRNKYWRIWFNAFSRRYEDYYYVGANRVVIGNPGEDLGDDIVLWRYGVYISAFFFDWLLSKKKEELVRKLLYLKHVCA